MILTVFPLAKKKKYSLEKNALGHSLLDLVCFIVLVDILKHRLQL